VPQALIDALQARFGPQCSLAQAVREQHGRDEGSFQAPPPSAVVFAQNTQDVADAVKLASQYEVPVIPYGAGSSLEGHLLAVQGGISIDVSRMNQVLIVNAEDLTVTVQPGITRKALNDAIKDTGLFFPIDPGADASIGGMAATRASGTNAVRYGTMRENVLALEVVTASAQVLRASAEENADLFWALRGGSGNFGIVTSFEYRLVPVGPEILGGAIAWRGDQALQVLAAYREFSAKAPRELTSVAVLRRAPPAPWLPKEIHGQPMAVIFVCYSGRPEEGEALLPPLRKLGSPVADIVMRRPYTQMQSLLDATQPKGRRYYWKSHYLPQVSQQAAEIAVVHADKIASPHSAILMFQIGGVLNEQPPGHSPAGNRDAMYVLNIAGSWEKPEDDEANMRWARDCFEAIRPCATGGTYLNFLTEEEGADRVQAAYGGPNLARLAELKRGWDPDNLFRHTKAVC